MGAHHCQRGRAARFLLPPGDELSPVRHFLHAAQHSGLKRQHAVSHGLALDPIPRALHVN
jgi:hypothetical protein